VRQRKFYFLPPKPDGPEPSREAICKTLSDDASNWGARMRFSVADFSRRYVQVRPGVSRDSASNNMNFQQR
jgi:hypothetical protein